MINKPHTLNALSLSLLEDLSSSIELLEADDNLQVVIITGEVKAFVAGADISEMKDMSANDAYNYAMLGANLF